MKIDYQWVMIGGVMLVAGVVQILLLAIGRAKSSIGGIGGLGLLLIGVAQVCSGLQLGTLAWWMYTQLFGAVLLFFGALSFVLRRRRQ